MTDQRLICATLYHIFKDLYMTLTQQGISITPCFKKHIETLCYEEGVVLGETITQFPCLVRTINEKIYG